MRNRGSALSVFSLQARPAKTKMALVGFLVCLRTRDNSCYQKRILVNPGFGKVVPQRALTTSQRAFENV